MVQDVIESAIAMMGLSGDSANLTQSAVSAEFLRLYNLVCDEIYSEYRREDYESAPSASALTETEAKFTGISPRVLAYGIATEYCITKGLDEAITWDKRYKSALALAKKPKITIQARKLL